MIQTLINKIYPLNLIKKSEQRVFNLNKKTKTSYSFQIRSMSCLNPSINFHHASEKTRYKKNFNLGACNKILETQLILDKKTQTSNKCSWMHNTNKWQTLTTIQFLSITLMKTPNSIKALPMRQSLMINL
jgi:hypothetical protein